MEQVRVSAPASVSNVGPGFDVFGFALHYEGEQLCLTKTDTGRVELDDIRYEGLAKGGSVPSDPEKNIAAITIRAFLDKFKIDSGLRIEMTKKLPIGSGLGSSACSAVAAVKGADALFETHLSKEQMLEIALQGERHSSGSEHLDNIAPCLFGNFVIVRSMRPIAVVPVSVPANLLCTVILPDHVILTQDARKVLPEQVQLGDMVHTVAHASSLIVALLTGDLQLLKEAIDDRVVEPLRSALLPNFSEAKLAATAAGALGFSISGSGPAVFAFSDSPEVARRIGSEVVQAFSKADLKAEYFVSAISSSGAHIL